MQSHFAHVRWFVVGLVLAFVLHARAEEDAGVAWPRLVPRAKAVHRSNVVFASEDAERSNLTANEDSTWLEWSYVVAEDGRSLSKTSGRAWGVYRGRVGGRDHFGPISGPVLRANRGFPAPGTTDTVPYDPTQKVTGFPAIEHPDEPPHVGLTWTHREAIPNGHVVFKRPVMADATSRVVSIDEHTISIRSTYPERKAPDGARVVRCVRMQSISRVDGFTQHMECVTWFEAPPKDGASSSFQVRNALVRRPWATEPKEVSVVSAALEALADDDGSRRAEAARTLGAAWPEGARGVPVLVAALKDDAEEVRGAARHALRSIYDHGITALGRFVADDKDPYRAILSGRIEVVLRRSPTPTALDAGPAVKWEPRIGTLMLALLAERTPPSILDTAHALLVDRTGAEVAAGMMLRDPKDAEIAAAALALLGQAAMKPDAARMPEDVVRLLADEDPILRWLAVRALHQAGAAHPDVIAALRTAATDEDERVRGAAERALTERFRTEEESNAPTGERVDDGPADVEALVRGIEAGPESAEPSLLALEVLGPEAAPALPTVASSLLEIERLGGMLTQLDLLTVIQTKGGAGAVMRSWPYALVRVVEAIGPTARSNADAMAALDALRRESSDPLLVYLTARALRRIRAD